MCALRRPSEGGTIRAAAIREMRTNFLPGWLYVMTDEDAELVDRVRQGDRGAFAMLVERYEKPVYNLARRMVSDADDAADITQTVFLKAFLKIETYDPAHRFFGWIYRIAINESLNLLDSRGRRWNLHHGCSVDPQTPESQYDEAESQEYIRRALERMSLDQRVVIVLKHLLLLPCREIATILEIPEKTVKSRLFTARQVLRERLLAEGYVR